MKTYRPTRPTHTLARLFVLGLTAALSLSATAQQDNYPSKPVKLVVPFASGGGTDVAARIIATELSTQLRQTFIVENRPGGAGTLGTEQVARAAADGYTLCFCTTGALSVIPQYDPKLSYDPFKDLVGVSHVLTVENVIMARKTLPADTLSQLIELARKQPGTITFATPGAGGTQHLAGEWLQLAAKVRMVHVPYRGDSPALADLLGGQVDLLIGSESVARSLLKEQKVKVIANIGAHRSANLPEIPTVIESGYPGLSYVNFVGINAPANTPPAVVEKLSKGIAAVMADPAAAAKLQQAGYVPVGSTPAQYVTTMRQEADKWARVLKTVTIRRE